MGAEEAIKQQVLLLRTGYSIGIYPGDVPLLCNECDRENFKFAIVNDLGYEQISLTRLGIKEPFHLSSLIGFNSEDGPIWFLVDPTYGQFFKNNKFNRYMLTNHKEFSQKLLNQGYIICTLSNIKSYIDGFVYSKAFVNKVDVENVYNNLYDLLVSNKIITEENSYSSKKKK